ncbi:class I SAM-dependent methyltransferase [Methylomagnum ishizawai]|uniref:class I SAM-dependent methyltransferase n=1 Tax=Methylomagnum ishizawai TaxID=1760988 RepID=UPI001C32A344|nr:class I SAM-dependent methyltransferase [Methylomagnum ishizawai]BBL76207.1 SAM-dependent methyltransferase [Methylomagnum ishizawai]
MAFSLDQAVPWGRSFEEYRAMFALSEADLQRRILGCGDGPAGFNREWTRRGGAVLSIDPLYACSAGAIADRIAATYPEVMAQTRANAHEFVWDHIASVEALGRVRMAAMREFLADYPRGRAEGRYVEGGLPQLPYADGSFDLALCSHFLFLYSAHFPAEFHWASVRELCRVAAEVRIFPLLELGSARSRHLDGVLERLAGAGFAAEEIRVDYEFQRGGNRMLRIAPRIHQR